MRTKMLWGLCLGVLTSLAEPLCAQTDVSFFLRSDSVQRKEFVTPEADMYKLVGHHGPAIENMYMGLRIYFNNSGAIDVYTKKQPGLELSSAHWYPTLAMQEKGYGCDEYKVGKTVGLGGVNLWDGEKILPLTATEGREVRVSKDEKGAVAEMLAKGIPYGRKKVDVLIRVSMQNRERTAVVEAFAKGAKVCFVTGVNHHPGKLSEVDNAHIASWGKHPEDVSKSPIYIGGGMVYNPNKIAEKRIEETGVVLISKPTRYLKTKVVSAGQKENDLNTAEKFFAYVKAMSL